MKVLFLVNNPDFFLSHRLPLGIAARKGGFEVHVATPQRGKFSSLSDHQFIFHPVPMDRSAFRPWKEVSTFLALYRLYRSLRPDIVHHVTIKPVLYGTLIARITGVSSVVNAISGLGYVFIQQGWKARIKRALVENLYRLFLRHPRQKIIFQNPDDIQTFLKRGLVPKEDVVLIRGSGVDLDAFRFSPESGDVPIVMFPSRMLWDKGVREFVEAAILLKSQNINARFVLVGDTDVGNPTCAPTAWLEAQRANGCVEWWGPQDGMAKALAEAHVVCLPSYREGLPKVLLEAAACGRAIISTDVPGCREIARHGINALLVPPRQAGLLAEAISILVRDPDRRRRMGEAGRILVEKEFSEAKVVRETLEVYHGLLQK